MDRFVFHSSTMIPKEYIEEVSKLRTFIMKDMKIMISLLDTYTLWGLITNYGDKEQIFDFKRLSNNSMEECIKNVMMDYGCIVHTA